MGDGSIMGQRSGLLETTHLAFNLFKLRPF